MSVELLDFEYTSLSISVAAASREEDGVVMVLSFVEMLVEANRKPKIRPMVKKTKLPVLVLLVIVWAKFLTAPSDILSAFASRRVLI